VLEVWLGQGAVDKHGRLSGVNQKARIAFHLSRLSHAGAKADVIDVTERAIRAFTPVFGRLCRRMTK
jgi:hypothetical protein